MEGLNNLNLRETPKEFNYPEMKGLNDLSLKERTPLNIDGQSYYQYDGDTIRNITTGQSYRFPRFDAAEVSRIDKDGIFHAGSFVGPLHTEAINRVLREEQFGKLVPAKGQEDKTSYDRMIMDLENPRGERLSDYVHKNRIFENTRFITKEQEDLRGIGEFAELLRGKGSALSSGDRARELIASFDYIPGNLKKEVQGTFDEAYYGSSLDVNNLRSELNELKASFDKTEDPVEKERIRNDIRGVRDALTLAVNTTPTANIFGVPEGRVGSIGKPGWWGESINAGEKSFHQLSNTMGGFSAWLGDSLNSEALEDWGNDWALETNQDFAKAGYTTDFWSVRNPWDALRFISSSIIQYAPQMGAIWTSSAAGGAIGSVVPGVGTGVGMLVGGIGAGFVLAVSQIYQRQPEGEKDPMMAAVIATPIALAELIGVKGLAGINILTKQGKQEAVELLSLPVAQGGKNLSKEEAERQIKEGVKKILGESADFLKDTAAKQLLARKTFKDLVLMSGKAGTREMLTESVQQYIEEVGLTATTSLDLDMEQLVYDMIEAGAVGGVVGAGFNVPFSISEIDKHNDLVWELAPEDPATRKKVSLWEEAHQENNKKKKLSQVEVLDKYRNLTPKENLSQMAGKAKKGNYFNDFFRTVGGAGGFPLKRFFQAFRGGIDQDYDTAGGDINFTMQEIGATVLNHLKLQGLFTGASLATDQRSLDSIWNAMVPSRADMSTRIGIKEKELYFYLNKTENELFQLGLPEKTIQGIQGIKQKLAILGQRIQEEVKRRNEGFLTNRIDLNYNLESNHNDYMSIFSNGEIFKYPKALDYKKVGQGFADLLAQEKGPFGMTGALSQENIEEIVEQIRNRALSLENRAKLDDIGVFNNPKYIKYMSQRPYEDITSFIRMLSTDVVMQERFGKENDVIASMLETAHKKGEISKQEMYNKAALLSNFIDMNKGKYKPIKNKVWRRLQDTALFASTLTYMDFNFIANMGEMVNGTIGLTPRQMWGYMGTVGRTFAKQFALDLRRGVALTGAVTDKTKRELAKDDIAFQRGIIAGTVPPRGTISYLESTNTSTPAYQDALNLLWIVNQVESQTNSIRMARGGYAWTNLLPMVMTVAAEEGGVITRKSRHARDNLNYYGLDPDRLVYLFNKAGGRLDEEPLAYGDAYTEPSVGYDSLSTEEQQELREYYRVGLIRYSDEMTVRPESASGPKLLENQQWGLFTQFTRFIAHFTANVIPRVWDGYILSGKPRMKRSVFNTIMAAYLMAFVSQMCKDMIVYGEKAPWLDDEEEDPDWLNTSYSRAASYTGWLGTPYMILEYIDDYNKQARRLGPYENIIASLTRPSPALNTVYRDAKNEAERTLGEIVARRIPFGGDIKPVRESTAEALDALLKKIGN